MAQMRPLRSLPKAHLHLHAWQAVTRRATVADCLSACSSEQIMSMRSKVEEKLSELRETSQDEDQSSDLIDRNIEKYERRLEGLTPPLSVDKILGPVVEVLTTAVPHPLRGGSGPESEIWDRQFFVASLMTTAADPQELNRRVCIELAEDAQAEGICWMELAYSAFKFVDGEVAKITDASVSEWRHAFSCRKDAMAAYPNVGIGFIPHCPKGRNQAEEAKAIISFFIQEGEQEALAGIGKWGREGPGLESELGLALAVFRENKVPLVMLHGGEGYGATGEKLPRSSYDGAAIVREAVAAGARRIGHGIEAAKDEATMALLKERNVCLEVCPFSNWLLAMTPWESLPEMPHPLPLLLAQGVPCCLAADDPTLMGASNGHGLLREYEAARTIMGLSDQQLADMARTSIKSSCMPESGKEAALAEIEQWLS